MCNKGEQTWLHIGSTILALNFVLLYPCLIMLTLHLCNGTLSIAWNVHNSHFSRFSLPCLTFKHITVFIHIEIKSCRMENYVCLVGGLQECFDQTYMDNWKTKDYHITSDVWLIPRNFQQPATAPPLFKRSLNSNLQ